MSKNAPRWLGLLKSKNTRRRRRCALHLGDRVEQSRRRHDPDRLQFAVAVEGDHIVPEDLPLLLLILLVQARREVDPAEHDEGPVASAVSVLLQGGELLHEPRRLLPPLPPILADVEAEGAPPAAVGLLAVALAVLGADDALGRLLRLPASARGDNALPAARRRLAAAAAAAEQEPLVLEPPREARLAPQQQRAGAVAVDVHVADDPVRLQRHARRPRLDVVAHALLRRRVEVDARRKRPQWRRHRARRPPAPPRLGDGSSSTRCCRRRESRAISPAVES